MNIEHNTLLRLPVSTQEFIKLRENHLFYVDKTDIVYELANAVEDVVFFSRPRRFGKTILLSTLEAYFRGRRELFEGLKIMSLEKEWIPYEVLRFDMSGPDNAEMLRANLSNRLEYYENIYGINAVSPSLGVRFGNLVQRAAKEQVSRVVILIDEYDYALQHTLFVDAEEHEKCKSIYREFFAVLKSASLYIRYIFITGVTKFTRLSLFSVMNNINNISFDTRYQALCGISQEELETVLRPYVAVLAEKQKVSIEHMFMLLKEKYDGYHFSGEDSIDIYNPYSLINALNKKKLTDNWAVSGSSSMLVNAIDNIGVHGDSIGFDDVRVSCDRLEGSDVSLDDLSLFLYQTGYLTIKGIVNDDYVLGIPNGEVRKAVYNELLPRALSKEKTDTENVLRYISDALECTDVQLAMSHLKAVVAGTAYSPKSDIPYKEYNFQTLVGMIMTLCNCRVTTEKPVSTGRIDLVCEHTKCILIMELKLVSNGGAEAAVVQMEKQHYADAYLSQSKPVFTVGISFDAKVKRIEDVVVKRVK